MTVPDDPGLVRVLERFGVVAEDLLGRGGEARVYALADERVARVHHAGTPRDTVAARTSLLSELARSSDAVSFAIPRVLETLQVEDRIVTIERRLGGRPFVELLNEATGTARASLVRAYLEAAAGLGDLAIERPWCGDLCQREPIRCETFRGYLEQRAARSLSAAGAAFAHVDARALAEALPEPREASFVHLDAFAGNMLGDGEAITAVLDFGVVALVGDRRLDPLAAVAYLTPDITPAASDSDRAVADEWLAETELSALYHPARRWLAAFWSLARDDVRLHGWCRSVLCQVS